LDNIPQGEGEVRMKRKYLAALMFILLVPLVFAAFTEDTSLSFDDVEFSSHAWADYDNDGDYDLVLSGKSGSQRITKVYENTGGSFSEDLNQTILGVQDGAVVWMDYNNDGNIDLIVTGYNGSTIKSQAYTNNGTHLLEDLQPINETQYNSLSVGDYNNDGNLDLVLIGCNDIDIDSCTKKVVKTYTGDGISLIENATWSQNLPAVWRGSIALGDYDNDGDLDLALSGTTTDSISDAITKIYKNNGTTFIEDTNQSIPGIFYGSLAWIDYDNDGDLDLGITGAQSNGTKFTGIFKNDQENIASNTNPSAPSEINATYTNNQFVLNWSDGSDSETPTAGLYYNLRVGSNQTNAADSIMSSQYPTSSNPTQGYFGNMMQSQNKTLNIDIQCIFYQVQTIDTGFATSSFTTVKNFSSDEICNSYDQDCDFEIDEGLDINNDDLVDANETYDKDGDGYFPQNGTLINSSGGSNSTYTCTNYAQFDCDDSNANINPGASEICGNGIDENCDGFDSSCSSGGGGGGTRQQIQEALETKTEETSKPAVEQLAPVATKGRDDSIIEKLITDQFRYTREVQISGSRTQITETIKGLSVNGLDDTVIKIFIPKDIEDKASDVIKVDDFEIIKEDPEIEFTLGHIEPLAFKQIQYAFDRPLGKDEVDSIVAEISVREEDEGLLEQQIEETSEVLNITQKFVIDVENNITIFTIDIEYARERLAIGDVFIYTEIPKCLVNIINEDLIESDQEFEIVSADPLIVWHFDDLIDVEQLSYNIKAISDEDCANEAIALAIAKQIVQVKYEPKLSNILIVLSIIPIILILMFFFGTFSKEIEHYNPKINRLIAYVKHHYRHGFRTKHIKEKLKKEKYTEEQIEVAMSLNAKTKFHHFVQKLEIGFEELILVTLIILNLLDFTELLPGDADYIKKIISWTILGFVLYRVSITKLIFGKRSKFLDVGLLLGYFSLTLKNMVGFANAAFIDTRNEASLVTDLYAYIIQHNQLFEIWFFIVGIAIILVISIYLAFTEEVIAPSFLNIIHFHPKKSKNPFKILWRFIVTHLVLLAFFIFVFNLMFEWLAIAVDALILIITIAFILIFLIKHRHKFTAPKLMQDITESSERFYEKFINLFHYKSMLLLGISGMLVLHILTELGNFLIPYLTGIHDAIYFGNFYEGHLPIFNLVPSATKSLFATQAAGLALTTQLTIWLGFILNVIAALYLILVPAYIWYHMFKNRKYALKNIPSLRFNRFHIFLSLTSITFIILKPAFSLESLKTVGLVGVDVQTKLLDLVQIEQSLAIAIGVGLLGLVFSLIFKNFVKKLVLSASILFFVYYIYLFFGNTATYYVTSIQTLVQENLFITVYLVLFFIINIIFYLSGVYGLFVELYLRGEIWFDKHKIKHIEKLKQHHRFAFIHHEESHKVDIHGDKHHHIEEYIKTHLMEGEQLHTIVEHLIKSGWNHALVYSAKKAVIKDRVIMHVAKKIEKLKE